MKQLNAFGAATQQSNWPIQEDSYFIDPMASLYALSNGFGGKNIGDRLAAQSIDKVQQTIKQLQEDKEKTLPFRYRHELSHEENIIYYAFAFLNEEIYAENQEKSIEDRSGCSLSLAHFHTNQRATFCNIGSNSFFLLRKNALQPIMLPQSKAISLGNTVGGFDTKQGRDFPLRAIGIAPSIECEIKTCQFQSGDIVLIFSDGFISGDASILTKSTQVIIESKRAMGESLEELAKELLAIPLEQKNHANRTVLLIEIVDSKDS